MKIPRALTKEQEHLLPLLTPRERDFVVLYCKGLTQKEIAEQGAVNLNRVQTVLKSAWRKLLKEQG